MKLEVIIAPIVIFCLMTVLLIAARFYDRSPVQLPPCGFKKWTGVPCVACRGTRSVQSLSRAQLKQAFLYNPLAVSSCVIALFWIGGYVVRKGDAPRKQLASRTVIVVTIGLIVANWIYLILTDHWYPS